MRKVGQRSYVELLRGRREEPENEATKVLQCVCFSLHYRVYS